MRRLAVLLLMMVVTACSGTGGTTGTATPTSAPVAEATPLVFDRVLPDGMIHVLENPEFVSASEATGRIESNEMVMGLKIGDDVRAYPIGLMRRYELVNDVAGDEPVAVTFCPSCNIGLAFSRKTGDQTLTFDVTGMLLDAAMVMKDRENGSLWSQSRLQALDGALEGTKLDLIVTNQMPWSQWVQENPDTTLLIDPRVPPRAAGGLDLPMVPSGNELKPDSYNGYVAGVAEGETAAAYPLDAIQAQGVVNADAGGIPVVFVGLEEKGAVASWSRVVDGQTLTFSRDGDQLTDAETGTVWNVTTGVAESGTLAGSQLATADVWICDWQGWLNAYPDTSLELVS